VFNTLRGHLWLLGRSVLLQLWLQWWQFVDQSLQPVFYTSPSHNHDDTAEDILEADGIENKQLDTSPKELEEVSFSVYAGPFLDGTKEGAVSLSVSAEIYEEISSGNSQYLAAVIWVIDQTLSGHL
jgi:hypothetical protein